MVCVSCIGKLVRSLLAGLIVAVAMGTAAQAERRVALVIGNSKYDAVAPLANPRNDAELMARTLESVGFEVTTLIDADQRTMKQAMLAFGDRLRGGVDASLFYYAGHGVQVRNGNYLIPVDAQLNSENSVELEAVNVDAFLQVLNDAAGKVNIVILDACRNNPFPAAARGGLRGLSRVTAPTGTYIAYSTAPNEVADDGNAGNSPYTRALAAAMVRPGLKIEDTFKETRRMVLEATNRKQTPWESTSITGDFYFKGSAPPDPRLAEAERVWAATQASTSVAVLSAFIERFRGTVYADFAAERLAELQKLAALPPVDNPGGGSGPAGPAAVCTGGVVASVGGAGVAAAARRCLKPKDTFRDCPDICPEMVVIPPGRFTMGSPASEKDRYGDEGPQHEVTIGAAFAVGKLEVTRGQFAAFVNDSGYKVGDSCWAADAAGKWADTKGKSFRDPGFKQEDTHPAVCVSWDDARAYVSWLSRKTGKPYRLLSEAEWEFAGRAGTTTPYWFGSDVNSLCGYANGGDATAKARFPAWTWAATCQDNYVFTAPGGSFAPNDFGLFDMAGNVWEWTEDCWHENYNGAPSDGSAWTTGDYTRRVLRGGSWSNDPGFLRAAFRGRNSTDLRGISFGLRVARTLTP